MTEKIHEQISAFIDDELSAEEGAFLIRRLVRDSEASGQLARYAMIGSALRGELVRADESALRTRIQASLGGAFAEPVKAGSRKTDREARPGRVVAAAGVAVAVAGAALFGLRMLNQAALEGPVESERSAATVPSFLEPATYVVPQEFTEALILSPPIRLTNYLMQHGSFASPLSRNVVDAKLVGVFEAETDDDDATVPGVQW
jgi:anti-sigma factor RsiW